MVDLTARQIQILRAIVQEFIDSAEAVGSETLDKKYSLGVSPATIRNDMVQLTEWGYLQKSHSSAGRQPTSKAIRLYVRELMKEQDLSVADEVSVKERIWGQKEDVEDLLRASAKILAEKTGAIGIALSPDQYVYSSGYSHLLNMPEFYDIEVMRHVLSLIEEYQLLNEIFNSNSEINPVKIVFGSELGNRYLDSISLVFVTIDLGGKTCQLGVLGSYRFDFKYVLPMLRYFRGLVTELSSSA